MIGRTMSARCSCMCVLGENTRNTPPPNRASTPAPSPPLKTSKSKTQLWPCSTCRAHRRGYRGIHQSASTVADINYPELRSISPQFALLLHACPITFLTAHYKGQGDTRLTKERNTNWNIFSASNMSSPLESCSLHLFLINAPTFVPLRFKAKLFVRRTSGYFIGQQHDIVKCCEYLRRVAAQEIKRASLSLWDEAPHYLLFRRTGRRSVRENNVFRAKEIQSCPSLSRLLSSCALRCRCQQLFQDISAKFSTDETRSWREGSFIQLSMRNQTPDCVASAL